MTGKTLWTSYTIADARPLARNAVGTQLWGPSGASIWSTPTIDAKKRVLYVGTGDNHSAPATDTSDAVLAMELDTGRIAWKWQLLHCRYSRRPRRNEEKLASACKHDGQT